MNCDEYRQSITADPSFDGGAGHLGACAPCRAYRDEMRSLDAKIAAALAIDVPELVMPDLPEAGTVVALGSRKRWSAPAWLGMAAAVAVVGILGVRMFGVGVGHESLADEVLAHLDHEPRALRVTDVAVSDDRLRSIVPTEVASFDRSASLISYAQSCIINGRTVPHLVIQGATGPVTVLLMPEERVGDAITLQGENVHGVILPVGDGSIAIIGGADESLENIQNNVVRSVTWTT